MILHEAAFCLLYKIDPVLLGRNRCHGLEMAMEMALIKKTALKCRVGNIKTLS